MVRKPDKLGENAAGLKAVEKCGRLHVFVTNARVCHFAEFLGDKTIPSQSYINNPEVGNENSFAVSR
ncbi:unnamed protein product [Calypogeia fissa]